MKVLDSKREEIKSKLSNEEIERLISPYSSWYLKKHVHFDTLFMKLSMEVGHLTT